MRTLLTTAFLLNILPSLSAQTPIPAVRVAATKDKPGVLAGSPFELAIWRDKNSSDLHEGLLKRDRIILFTEPLDLELVKRGTPLSEVMHDGVKYYVENTAVEDWKRTLPGKKKPELPAEPTPVPTPTPPMRVDPPKPPIETPATKPTPKTQPTKPATTFKEAPAKPGISNEETETAATAVGATIFGLSFVCFAFVVVVALIYHFLPVIIALMRGHNNTAAIAATVIFLGWTGVGWGIAMVWAFSNDTRETERRRYGKS